MNLGPVNPTLQVPGVAAQNGSGLEYNPRCLRRDISADAARWTATPYVLDLIVNKTTITTFQGDLQGDFPKGLFGVHAGGHFTIGGDPGGVRSFSLPIFRDTANGCKGLLRLAR